MVKTKKMNEIAFAEILKEFHAVGELIRARQDEKQAILDQFDSESRRFFFGKVSVKALESSIKKANKEINRLDKEIKLNINKAKNLSGKMNGLVSSQAPKMFRATMSGVSGGESKKKRRSKKKPAKVIKVTKSRKKKKKK